MMQKIIVDKNLLSQKLEEMQNGDSTLIELCIVPGEIDDEAVNPAFLHFGFIRQNGTYEDHESIDECALTGQFMKKSA
jgi:hypothetical protein